ncbi:hypothetical protein BY996DRAFT_6585653 [Phakopsora pachyrhizi]|nr:hypothetical protein BY996DRAFT_6585653 [Phakopsora pachyrhizi]
MDRFKVCGYQVEIDRKKRLGEDEMGAEDNEERGCNLEGHRWNGKDVNVEVRGVGMGQEEDDKREKDWPGEREEDEVEGVIQLELLVVIIHRELCGIGIGKFGQLPKTLQKKLRVDQLREGIVRVALRPMELRRGMGEVRRGLRGKSQMKQPENDNTDKVKMNKDGKTQARDGGIDVGELTRDSRSITSDRMKLKLRLEWTETVAN